MNVLKVMQNMWLGAMILLFLFTIVQYYHTGLDTRIFLPLIGSGLCFAVYHNLGKYIEKKEKRKRRSR